jgi:hypothetical protein
VRKGKRCQAGCYRAFDVLDIVSWLKSGRFTDIVSWLKSGRFTEFDLVAWRSCLD